MQYIVNGEYELDLFKDELGSVRDEVKLNLRESLEFLFFFINQDSNSKLCSFRSYQESYFEYLKQLGVVIPEVLDGGEGKNWFGKLENLELEKKLNSKLYTYQLIKEMGYPIDSQFEVSSTDELSQAIQSNPDIKWLVKSPYLEGGMGFEVVTVGDDLPNIRYGCVVEPLLERKLDIVYHYNPETKKELVYFGKCSPKGVYQGGLVFENPKMLEAFIAEKKMEGAFNLLKTFWKKLAQKVNAYPLNQPYTFDSFIYKNEKGYQAYPLTEINYRVNKGTLIENLFKFLPKDGVGELVLIADDSSNYFNYSQKSKNGIIMLDHRKKKKFLFVAGDSFKKVQTFKKLLFT